MQPMRQPGIISRGNRRRGVPNQPLGDVGGGAGRQHAVDDACGRPAPPSAAREDEREWLRRERRGGGAERAVDEAPSVRGSGTSLDTDGVGGQEPQRANICRVQFAGADTSGRRVGARGGCLRTLELALEVHDPGAHVPGLLAARRGCGQEADHPEPQDAVTHRPTSSAR